MGCAKHYAASAGMGAQLMTEHKIAEDIVKTLRRNLSIPVSVKTRIFARKEGEERTDVQRTCEWVHLLQSAGASAVAVHARLIL